MNNRLFILLLGLIILPISSLAFAAPITGIDVPELSGLDDVVNDWLDQYNVKAATLAVIRNGKLVYEKGYGYQNKELTDPILPTARMRLATNSVAMTKRALRQLIAEGLLSPNELVYQVVDLQPWQGAYADSAMQQITVQQLLEDKSCLMDNAPSVKEIGQLMGLGRNATLAESIQYLWSVPSTMQCAPPGEKFSHYAMEIAGYIIAKRSDPSFDNSDFTAVGNAYGHYIGQNVAEPIETVFFQAENHASEAHENEIWYDSGERCNPEWNRNWDPNQPEVSCAYSIDFFARPGSGTLVSSARDYAHFLENYQPDGIPVPDLSQAGWYEYNWVGYGSLPGTSTVASIEVNPLSSNSTIFVFLANRRNESPGDDYSFDEIMNGIRGYLGGITTWPTIDFFDVTYSCAETTDTNDSHVAAGRAYTETTGFWFNRTTTWYAVGSDDELGTSGADVVTLKEDPPGYFSQGGCSDVDNTPPKITLQGDNPLELSLGSTFSEPGFSAQDNVDGDITGQVVVTGTVDTNIEGTYYKYYDVEDNAGNAAATATRTIIVTEVEGGCD